MKAYLDTNIVSSIARDDNVAESKAIRRLVEARNSGKVQLVTSPLTLDEIKRVPPEHYAAQETTYRQLKEVPLVPWDELLYVTQSSED